jgi:galactokinase
MSSSSALIIAVAVALGRLGDVQNHPAWTANIRTRLDAAGYYACIENGRRFASLEGDGGVGTHGGSEDHTAIVDGRPGHVSAYAFVPPRSIGSATIPDAWRFVVAPSGVAARKTAEANIPYNRLSAGVSRLLEIWNWQMGRPAEAGSRDTRNEHSLPPSGGRSDAQAASLAAALRSDPHAYERLRDLCAAGATDEAPAGWLRDRLDHFVREDARVEEALAAFASGDGAAIGGLAADSQEDAEALLRNQVPATSALAAEARRLGALAACSFGAGFGGAVWALVHASDAEGFAIRWKAGAFVMMPAPPVTEVAPPWKHSSGI